MDKPNYKDFTLKSVILDSKKTEMKLMKVGAKFIGEDEQEDRYFKVSNGKLKFRRGTLGSLITHYERIVADGIEKTVVYRYDINPNPEAIRELYTGSILIGLVKKRRRLYQLDNITIHIDELPNGSKYLEVEAKDFDGDYTEVALAKQCQTFIKKLDIGVDNLVKTGYLSS